jgi:hypothetical protein
VYTVDYFDFGRVSWYYEEVAHDPTPGDMSRFRYTPADVGARWILRQCGWPREARAVGQDWTAAGLTQRLASQGVVVQPLHGRATGGVAGGFVLASVETLWDQAITGGLDRAFDALEPGGRLFVAMEAGFASNRGFRSMANAIGMERQWLSLSPEQFARKAAEAPYDLAIHSPAILARLVCSRLGVAAEPSFERRGIDHFVLDPDVLTTPLGARVDSRAMAQRIASEQAVDAARRGISLLGLTRMPG